MRSRGFTKECRYVSVGLTMLHGCRCHKKSIATEVKKRFCHHLAPKLLQVLGEGTRVGNATNKGWGLGANKLEAPLSSIPLAHRSALPEEGIKRDFLQYMCQQRAQCIILAL